MMDLQFVVRLEEICDHRDCYLEVFIKIQTSTYQINMASKGQSNGQEGHSARSHEIPVVDLTLRLGRSPGLDPQGPQPTRVPIIHLVEDSDGSDEQEEVDLLRLGYNFPAKPKPVAPKAKKPSTGGLDLTLRLG